MVRPCASSSSGTERHAEGSGEVILVSVEGGNKTTLLPPIGILGIRLAANLNSSHSYLRNSMDLQDWNDLYVKLYDAYEFAGLRDEYVRSTLGDALDHMINLQKQNLLVTL